MKRAIETRFFGYTTFKILRLSYVFSRNDKFTSYLSACALENRMAEVFHPIYRRIVYIDDLMDLLRMVCIDWNSVPDPVLNVCGPELLSRVDIANLFETNVSNELRYRIVEPPEDFFLSRPKVVNMSNRNFERALGRPARSLKDAMQQEFHGAAR
jgi:dTDP-4-dehydrorhamnose reductase